MLKITAIGNLTNDVELKVNETTGKPYAILRIASDRRYRDRDGNRLTDFISIKVRGPLAERCAEFAWKGCKLAAVGDFETICFADDPDRQPGFLIKATEVEFLSPRRWRKPPWPPRSRTALTPPNEEHRHRVPQHGAHAHRAGGAGRTAPPSERGAAGALEADLLQNGCYSPVIVNEELVIVDGITARACVRNHGIPYNMAVFAFDDLLEPSSGRWIPRRAAATWTSGSWARSP